MMLNFIDRLGDWNPQLLRELKGRLKIFPVLIAFATSLIGQLIIFFYQLREFPGSKLSIYDKYCKLRLSFDQERVTLQNQLQTQYQQLQEQFKFYSSGTNYDATKLQEIKSQILEVRTQQDNIYTTLNNRFCPTEQINVQLWWRDHWEYIFLTLSVVFIFTLLVSGTYLLINNLSQEERRGTLNFLRLSPQPEVSILTGKLLGVPILIYLVTLTAVPLHIWAGSSAKIALSYILSFYAVLIAACIFFYSAALLFGIFCRVFAGFQPWLGSGAVLLFLMLSMGFASSGSFSNDPSSWLKIFSPFDITNYLFPNLFSSSYRAAIPLKNFEFFNLPLGQSVIALVGIHILNYGLWSYWIWQALKRCFRNPNATILSKQQSYFMVACFELTSLGFLMPNLGKKHETLTDHYDLFQDIGWLYLLNFFLVLGLIAILSPHRQTIQDWARYRHQNIANGRGFWNNSVLSDLIFGEKSPGILAIAINLAIAATVFAVRILIIPGVGVNNGDKIQALLGVILSISLMMIYATIAQIMLLIKTPKRSLWAIGTVGATILLPSLIVSLLQAEVSNQQNILWLFSSTPWYGIQHSAATTIFMATLANFSALALLNFQLTRQVKLAGESATKALLAGR
ncbi:MAG: ABC transporter permease subunit [Heteroscytonema crispum UTEX LB 1556]